MEQIPYTREMDAAFALLGRDALMPTALGTVTSEWQRSLPVLVGTGAMLRELRVSDAPALFAMLTTEEVARFISPPPDTVEGFERFIQWTICERAAGRHACFAVVPHGMDTAIGIFQVRQLGGDWATAEWGFAIGSAFWGTGLFADAARLVLDFTFDTIGVDRLEARAAVQNGRGNGALRKTGAVPEMVLRGSLVRHGTRLDQVLWSLRREDYASARPPAAAVVH